MFLFRMALKNLLRHKRRTLITSLIIAFAILIYILTDGLMIGLTDMSFRNIINLESGHLQIANSDYWEERKELPLKNLIIPSETLEEKIMELNGLKAYTKRLNFSVNLNNGIDELPVTGLGIDINNDKKVFELEEHIMEGRMPEPDTKEIIMGAQLAELMDFKVGSYAVMLIRTEDKTFNTIDGEVVGLLNTPHPTLNENSVFIPLKSAQDRLDVGEKITHYAVRVQDQERGIAAAEELNQKLENNIKAYAGNAGYRDSGDTGDNTDTGSSWSS